MSPPFRVNCNNFGNSYICGSGPSRKAVSEMAAGQNKKPKEEKCDEKQSKLDPLLYGAFFTANKTKFIVHSCCKSRIFLTEIALHITYHKGSKYEQRMVAN